MKLADHILWWGEPPTVGLRERFAQRDWRILKSEAPARLQDSLLSVSRFAVLQYPMSEGQAREVFRHFPQLITHGVLIFVVVADPIHIRSQLLSEIAADFAWDEAVHFVPNLAGVHFDKMVCFNPEHRWQGTPIKEVEPYEELTNEEKLLLTRAFGGAEEVRLHEVKGGRSGSRVFLAHEKRAGRSTSIAHWTLPRLVKIADRSPLLREVEAMRTVSPFVPFELRPNLDISIKGFRKAIYVADFVELSESLLDVARDGRAEAALSNLFYRTLGRWRDRGKQCALVHGSLVRAAERLDMMCASWVRPEYAGAGRIERLGIDMVSDWEKLAALEFNHRAATIHGDLHGGNVRVRGDDAILIDFGSVRGDTSSGKEAPLCFDVAMLEVALVFEYRGDRDGSDVFEQPDWEAEVEPYYNLDAVLRGPSLDSPPTREPWLLGCLQRIRAFGIYDQSHELEYPIALVIALWRWCKFPSEGDADRGRRVFALQLGHSLIEQILEKHYGAS